ncbi:hypothetical protein VCJ71_03275 [Alteriqipengyuania sp. WL0013]|uniref:hypothetical protein n=1 Tax=Alteriqipengyuania sp. WL0013 TaxID=3110773 RepID=UPI002C067AD5|nr:hypothetical protein [Alteriqipengyuania sp. WL0013]MEB3415083.1 hypothetical protein [Alteriqipengyuania sp. WL0013]
MTNQEITRPALLNPWRLLGWGIVATLIAIPAVATLFFGFTGWTGEDFVAAIIMLGGVGLAFEMAMRASGSWAYRGGAAVALGAALLLLWANGAVGIVGNEGNAINLWFNLVPLVALFGAIGARFKARGMAAAMTATAVFQLVVGVIVQSYGHFAWVFTGIWFGAWMVSAYLFRKAAAQAGDQAA